MRKNIKPEDFYQYGKRIEMRAGQTVYDAQNYATGQSVYFLDSGICALSQMTRSGEERIYLYFTAKKTIGFVQMMPSVIAHGTAGETYTIRAKTDAVLYRIPKKKFNELLESNDDFRTFMLDVLADNYVEILSRFHEAQEMAMPQRICKLLMGMTEMQNGRMLLLPFLSYAEIAKYLGTHTVTVSRIMAKLKNMGYISKDGRRTVIECPDKLQEIIDGEEITY